MVCTGFTLMKKNHFKCCVTWQLMTEAGLPFKGAWMAPWTFMSTGNHTKEALEIWRASFGSETIIFTVWLHLLTWCFELIWRITKTTDDLPSTRLSLWPTKATIIGWQSMDTEAPQATHCFRTRGLLGKSHSSFLYFALRMTCNIRIISESSCPRIWKYVEDFMKSRIPYSLADHLFFYIWLI